MPSLKICRGALIAVALTPFSAALGAPGETDDLLKHWKIEKFRWQGPIGENRTIEIRNDLGDVRARLSSDDQVFVSAVIQRHEDDPHRGDVLIGEKDGRMTLEPVFATRESTDPDAFHQAMDKRRIDLTVLVPLGVRLEIQTAGGLIEAKGLESDVQATSTSGDVVIRVAGRVEARTERGEIHVTLASTEWDGEAKLETVTGDVTVWLPSDADALVRAETSGLITTDYSIEIERRPAAGRKTATARIGEGKRRLRVESTKGNVRLLRSPG